jgi:hypothetical protein
MFSANHIIYIAVSLGVTAAMLIGFSFVRNTFWKNFILAACGILTFVIHISSVFIEFSADIFVPLSLCNVCMYLFLIVPFIKNKESKLFSSAAAFLAYAAFWGALLSLLFNDYLIDDKDITKYITVKSLLSHNFLLLGGVYLFIGGYVKIKMENILPFAAGLVMCMLWGHLLNGIYEWSKLPPPNAMYLQKGALDGEDRALGYVLGISMIVLTIIFLAIWDSVRLKKYKN